MIDVAALDAYRDGYRANMPIQDHQAFYERLASQYPNQNYADREAISDFLDWAKPRTVVELGGWDGAVAAAMLFIHERIAFWDNYEIANIPQACDSPRYTFHLDNTWLWEHPIDGDAFIASHVLEHLTEQHLDALIAALNCRRAYVDVPLDGEPNSWDGSTTTHILPLTISQFDDKWEEAGWRIDHAFHSPHGVPSHIRYLERETS